MNLVIVLKIELGIYMSPTDTYIVGYNVCAS
jgi:hypothetical protein